VRHTESGLAVPFFPLSEQGALLPEVVDEHVVVHMLHRGFALVVLACVLLAAVRVTRVRAGLQRHATLVAALVLVQVALGASVIWTAGTSPADGITPIVAPVPTSLHVVNGAVLLAAVWLLVLRSWRADACERGPIAAAPGAA
jgi:heme A synthase